MVQAATGLDVTVGARLPRADRDDGRTRRPARGWRSTCSSISTRADGTAPARRSSATLASSSRLAGARYVRVRPRALGRLSVRACSRRNSRSSLSGDDEGGPVAVVPSRASGAQELRPRSIRHVKLSAEEKAAASDARGPPLEGSALRGTSAGACLTEHPDVAAAVRRGRSDSPRTHRRPTSHLPATTAVRLAVPRLRAHVGRRASANRTVLGTGCPPCSLPPGRRASLGDSTPGTELRRSTSCTFVPYFLENETNPGIDACTTSSPTASMSASGSARTAVRSLAGHPSSQ